MDRQLYIDINHFARSTSFAHGFMAAYALWIGLGALGACLVLGWLYNRRRGFGSENSRGLAAVAWAGAGAVVAFAVNQPIEAAIGRVRPFVAIPGSELLLARNTSPSFPSDHAIIAGAVITGLLLARTRVVALLAGLVGLLLCFARVYVGLHYPSDVLVGLLDGGIVVLLGYKLAVPVLERAVLAIGRSPFAFLVGAVHQRGATVVGPAAHAHEIAATGSVRLLEGRSVRPLPANRTEEPVAKT